MQTRVFKPQWLPSLAALVVLGVTLALGNWQLGRAAQKEAFVQKIETQAARPPMLMPAQPMDTAAAREADLQPVLVRGELIASATVFIDNRMYKRQPGYYVLTPMKLADSPMHVVINRGWVPANLDRSVLPAIATPGGPVTVQGLARVPGQAFSLKEDAATGVVWQAISLTRFVQQFGLMVQPVYVEQRAGAADGLVRDWPSGGGAGALQNTAAITGMTADKHRGYAFQWFALAALVVVLWFFFSFKQVRPDHE
jgi:surfeit locus 1 family protein